MRAFTHYWKNDTCEHQRAQGADGKPLHHTAGSMFTGRGVRTGDIVYVLTVTHGRLLLIGRMTVAKILSDSAARKLLGENLWQAPEHLIATPADRTLHRFNREVPLGIVKKLQFESPKGPTSLRFKSEWQLDQQTLRGVRRLTASSAALLDSVLR